ncbi:hypothetical protein DUNSADRAFT_15438 [Dunaliella salina]|uniref:Encoded protein n=1 Tax=Dunaliella salina TaxID=3046 RepID=A0ABQ7G5F0_DUNSA|nr:hypothetical protein DUNSADRAFT_15438 [Dunaliella salina]|eukprot:KAF5829838.1 hypothetical protein DUNSADRAFT_15438 [Dunaliella salina]
METCHRLATYSTAPGVDAQSLAAALVPVLLWRLLPIPGTSTTSADVQRTNPHAVGSSASGMNIQALRSRLLSFKFGSGGVAPEGIDEEGKPRPEDGINGSNKEEDAMLDSTASAVDAGSLDPEGDTKGSAAATSGAGEKPKLSKQEAEAVARVIQHLIQHFDECFMTANA